MAYFRRNDGIIANIKSILARALGAILRGDAEISLGSRMRRDTDTTSRYQQGTISLHDIDHLL